MFRFPVLFLSQVSRFRFTVCWEPTRRFLNIWQTTFRCQTQPPRAWWGRKFGSDRYVIHRQMERETVCLVRTGGDPASRMKISREASKTCVLPHNNNNKGRFKGQADAIWTSNAKHRSHNHLLQDSTWIIRFQLWNLLFGHLLFLNSVLFFIFFQNLYFPI